MLLGGTFREIGSSMIKKTQIINYFQAINSNFFNKKLK